MERKGGVKGEWRGREKWRGSGEEGRSGGGVESHTDTHSHTL